MDEKTKSSSLVALSLGALIGVLAAILALVLQRSRRPAPPLDQADLTLSQPLESQPALIPGPGKPQHAPAGRAAPSISTSGSGSTSAPRWTTPTKYIMGVILFLGALVVLMIGRGVIPMVIFAAILALFINPFILMLTRRLHLKWAAAVALTYVLVILVLLLIPLLLFPNIVGALNFLFNLDYQQLTGEAGQAIAAISTPLHGYPVLNTVLAPMLDSLVVALKNFGAPGQAQPATVTVTLYSLISEIAGRLGALRDILGPVIALVVSALFTLIMAFQMSLAANQISGWYPDLIPAAYKSEYSALFENVSQKWISFLRGQLTLMLIIGLVTWVGNTILGVPFALLLGVIAGLLELIPSLGPILAAIPAVLLALTLGSTYLPVDNLVFALLVVGFYVLIQLLENQFIVPYVLGDAVDLPPLIVLIGTIAGASAFGILGALLATPVIATGNLVFQYIYRKILEPPPVPPGPEEKPSIWESVKGWARRIPLPGRKKPAEGAAVVIASSEAKPAADKM